MLLGQGWGFLGCVHREGAMCAGAESQAWPRVSMKIPPGAGTAPEKCCEGRSWYGQSTTQQKAFLCWMLLLLWPHCWEPPGQHRTIGEQTETPSPRAALLGLTWVGARWVSAAPSPWRLHGASGAARGPRSHRVLVQCRCWCRSHLLPSRAREQGHGGQERGQGAGLGDGEWEVMPGPTCTRVTVSPSSAVPCPPLLPPACPRHRSEAKCSPRAAGVPLLPHSGTDTAALGASSAAAGSLLGEETLKQHHLPDADHEEDEGFPH